jgi:MSHA biogenesis protein MshN
MSLINQVLQDLDKRQQGGHTADLPDVDAINPAPVSKTQFEPANTQVNKLEGGDFVRPELQFKSQSSLKNKPSKLALTLVSLVVTLALLAGGWQLYQNQGVQGQDPLEQGPQQLSQPSISAAANTAVAEAATEAFKQEVAVEELKTTESSVENQIEIRTDSAPALAKAKLTQPQTITTEPITSAPIALVSKAPTPSTPEPIAEEPMTQKLILQQSASLELARGIDSGAVQVVSDADTKLPTQGNMAVTEVVLTAQQRANKLMLKAETAENNGRFAEAKRDYLQVLALVPEQTDARKKLLGLYYAQGEISQAMALVEQAISGNPDPWQWVLLKAKLQQGSGALSMALVTLATIPDQGLWAKDKWAAQGDIAQKLGEFAIAEKAFAALTSVEANKALWWMGLAYAQDSQQQYELARQSYRMAIQRAGLSSSARTFIENRLKELGESR